MGYQTRSELAFNFFNFCFSIRDDFGFFIRNHKVVNTNRRTGLSSKLEAGVHDLVSEYHGILQTNTTISGVNQLRDRLFLHWLVNQLVRQTFRHNTEQQRTTDGGINHFGFSNHAAVDISNRFGNTNFHLRLQMSRTGLVSTAYFFQIRQEHTFAFSVDTLTGHPVQTQYHVLRRYDDWLTVRRRQYVVGCHHQCTSF